MNKKSAGILLYRLKNNLPEVLLAHPGGPFWANKAGPRPEADKTAPPGRQHPQNTLILS